MKKILKITLYTIIGLGIVGYAISYFRGEMKTKEWQNEKEEFLKNNSSSASENVHILTDTVMIDYLDEKRTLAVYLPSGYDTSGVEYPILYFLDGESLFDQRIQIGQEWEIDETIDSLNQHKCVVVGIYSSERRMKEYKPFPSTRWYSDWIVSGDQHADWIVEDLMPWVEKRFRVKKDAKSTFIGGASLGGLMSYYMLMKYNDEFGGAYVLSPSYWVNDRVYDLHDANENFRNQKIYFNAGQLETPTVDGIKKMEEILINAGMPKANIKLDVEEGLGHWHMTWRNGFRKAYPWMMGK